MAKGEVRYRMVLDATGFQKGIGVAHKALSNFAAGVAQGFGQEIYKSLSGIPDAMLGIVTAATAAGTALHDVAAQTGISAEGIQKLGFAAKLSGTSIESVTKAVAIMQRGIVAGDADFAKLGLSLTQLKAMSPEQAFTQVGAAIAGLKSPTEQAAAAMGVFGKGSAALLPMLKEFPQLSAQFEQLGITISSSMVGAFDDFGDAVDKVGMVWTGFTNNIAAVFATSETLHVALAGVTDILGMLSKAVNANQAGLRSWIDGGIILAAEGLATLSAAFGFVLDGVERVRLGWAELGGGWDKAAIQFQALADVMAHPLSAKGILEEAAKKVEAVDKATNETIVSITKQSAEWKKMSTDSTAALNTLVLKLHAADGAVHTSANTIKTGLGGALDLVDEKARKAAEAIKLMQQATSFMRSGSGTGLMDSPLPGSGAVPIGTLSGNSNPDAFSAEYFKKIRDERDKHDAGIKSATADTADWSAALQDVANQFQTLGALMTGTLGDVVKSIGSVATGIAGIGSNLKGLGVDTMGGFGKSLGKVGNALGIVGAVGGIVGGIVGLFKKKKAPEEPKRSLPEQLAEAVKKSKELGTVGDRDVRKLLDQMKGTAEATAYLNEQLDLAVSGVGKFMASYQETDEKGVFGQGGIQIAPGDKLIPQMAQDQATIFTATFWGEVAQKGVVAASDAMRESYASFMKTLKALGGDKVAEEILGPAGRLMDLTGTNKAFRGAVEGAQGLADTTTGLGNAGLMTQGTFDAIGRQTAAAFQQAMDAGGTKEEALAGIMPALNAMNSAAENLGLDMGPELAGLMQQANEAGFKIVLPVQERIAKATESMAASMGRGWGAGATSTTYGGGLGLSGPTSGTGTYGGWAGYKPTHIDVSAASGYGPKKISKDTVFQAHAGEHVLIVPSGHPVDFKSSAGGFGKGGGRDGGGRDREHGGGGGGGGGGGQGGGTGPITSGGGSGIPQPKPGTGVAGGAQAIKDLAAAVKKAAEKPAPGPISFAPVVQVAVDPAAIKKNKDAFFAEVSVAIAKGIKSGSSPLLTALDERGYARKG